MPGVLSRILGGQVEASVQTSQLLDRLLPEHLLLVPCLDLPALRRSFLICTCETHLSTSNHMMDFSDCAENVRFQVVHVSWDTRSALVCPETQTFPCRRSITESDITFAQHGINFALGPSLLVSLVSAMMITLSLTFTLCKKNISSEQISTDLSVLSS